MDSIDSLTEELFLRLVCHEQACGSQRCDGSHDFIEGCKLYREFKKTINDKAEELRNT